MRLAETLAARLSGLALGGAESRDTQLSAAVGATGGAPGGPGSNSGSAGPVDPDIEAFDRSVEGQLGGAEKVDKRAVPPCYKVGRLHSQLGCTFGPSRGIHCSAAPKRTDVVLRVFLLCTQLTAGPKANACHTCTANRGWMGQCLHVVRCAVLFLYGNLGSNLLMFAARYVDPNLW